MGGITSPGPADLRHALGLLDGERRLQTSARVLEDVSVSIMDPVPGFSLIITLSRETRPLHLHTPTLEVEQWSSVIFNKQLYNREPELVISNSRSKTIRLLLVSDHWQTNHTVVCDCTGLAKLTALKYLTPELRAQSSALTLTLFDHKDIHRRPGSNFLRWSPLES